jgi:hypothetical protein
MVVTCDFLLLYYYLSRFFRDNVTSFTRTKQQHLSSTDFFPNLDSQTRQSMEEHMPLQLPTTVEFTAPCLSHNILLSCSPA